MTKNAVTPDTEVEETETEITFSAKDLAAELGTDAKSFRRWLRNYTPERAADAGGRWAFTADRKAELIAAYKADDADAEVDEDDESEVSEAE